MNKTRRKDLCAIWNKLTDILEDIKAIKEAEEDSFENLPESLQQSEKGQNMEDNVYQLEEVISSLNNCTYILDELTIE